MKQHWNDKTGRWEPLIHADEIRSMNNEELAEFIGDVQRDALDAEGCTYGLRFPDDKAKWLDWLQQPAEE